MQKLTFQLTYPTRGTTHGSQVLIIDPKFQLTYPLRGTTDALYTKDTGGHISTHVPHAGYDVIHYLTTVRGVFQLTYPTRGTPRGTCAASVVAQFQLTHPIRGATRYC